MADRIALVGPETLIGRELRDLLSGNALGADLRLIAAEEEEQGKLTEAGGEPTFVAKLDPDSLDDVEVIFLAGAPESTRDALNAATPGTFVDLTYACEDDPRAKLRAPMIEPPGYDVPPGAIHVIAHPAAIAIALTVNRIHRTYPVRRAVAHVFEPASERGVEGIDEIQQQTLSLLSFKPLPTKVYGSQVSFALLAGLGEEAEPQLEVIESRIERHLATLLEISKGAPMPSLRLIHAPVFHGYSISFWIELEQNPGIEALEQVLSQEPIELTGSGFEPPNNVSIAGRPGITAGALATDRNYRSAVWLWVAADNLRLRAENAVMVAGELV